MRSNKTFLAKKLWKILNPKDWPITLADLPQGSALVGGSVRDGLLNRLNQFPDLDFVNPVGEGEFDKKKLSHEECANILIEKKNMSHTNTYF